MADIDTLSFDANPQKLERKRLPCESYYPPLGRWEQERS